MAALESALRGGAFRNSRCHVTCREARRNHQTQTKKRGATNKKRGPTDKQTTKIIVPGFSQQQFRIFASSFSKFQNIDKLPLKLREAWNDTGTRKHKHIPIKRAKKRQETNNKNMQSADQVTASDPESPELKALKQSAISWGDSDVRSAEARNPQKHGAQSKTVNRTTGWEFP